MEEEREGWLNILRSKDDERRQNSENEDKNKNAGEEGNVNEEEDKREAREEDIDARGRRRVKRTGYSSETKEN